jgi:hypothetical protein
MISLLYAPETYWALPEKERKGGCGPGKFGDKLVPDSIWGLNIKPVCSIHDHQYAVGETIEDKDEADRVFLNNMLRLIDSAGGNWIIKALRRHAAAKYYSAVADFGGPSFWKGKNPAGTMQMVRIK